MIVLGIDPGSKVTGYGLVEKKDNEMTCIHSGHIAPSGRIPFYNRIHFIFQATVEILERYRPREMAIEDLFYAKNVKSSLKLGHARGAVLIAAVQCNLHVIDERPVDRPQVDQIDLSIGNSKLRVVS